MALGPPTKTIGFILWHELAAFFLYGSDSSLHWVIHGGIFKGLFDSWLKEGYFLETKSKRDWHRFGSLPSIFCTHSFFKKNCLLHSSCLYTCWTVHVYGLEHGNTRNGRLLFLTAVLTLSLCPWPGWLCLQCPISVPVPSVTGSFSARSQGRGHRCTLPCCHLLCWSGVWLKAQSGKLVLVSLIEGSFRHQEVFQHRAIRAPNHWKTSKICELLN